MSFLVYQILWFLKDVSNEMLGFDVEEGSEIKAKNKKKSSPLEDVEKHAKMIEKMSPKWSKNIPKEQKKQ